MMHMHFGVVEQILLNNNIPDRKGQNFFTQDPNFHQLLKIYLPEELYHHLVPHFEQLGADVGGYLEDLAANADKHPPRLQQRDRHGCIDQKILKHPDYMALEKVAYVDLKLASMSHQEGAFGWNDVIPPMAKFAMTYLFVQAEFGLSCAVNLTDALIYTLCKYASQDLIDKYLPLLTTDDPAQLLQGAMFMTETGTGSDLSKISTIARLQDGVWHLTGDKWFCSNPDAGLAMVLAQVEGEVQGMDGLGLFLMPRVLDDGQPNHYQILRLKDKLGTRSMATGEIRLEGAAAYLLGDIGRGFQQMAHMINLSRLSSAVRAAGLMRHAVGEALYVCKYRNAFGRALEDLPLQRKQLLKMMLLSEQARSMMMHTTLVYNQSKIAKQTDSHAAKCVRILIPLIKFRTCRDARKVAGDAMEIRGGCGYIEDWTDPRTLRDAHQGSIWGGSSNIVALDVLRAAERDDALPELKIYLQRLLAHPEIPAASLKQLHRSMEQVWSMFQAVIEEQNEADARKVSSALYHLCSAVVMAWEAVQLPEHWQRLAWAHMVMRYQLSPQNPLHLDRDARLDEAMAMLIQEQSMSLAQAMSLLPEH